MKEVPVYLFLGFLDAGKTTYIQETFEDESLETAEKTLLLVCEEGEVEYDSSRFAVSNTAVEVVPIGEITSERLTALARKHKPTEVVVEYNGMAELGSFFDAMPDGWLIAQVMTLFDAATFLQYNRNMRQLVFDKIQYSDLVVFNRFRDAYSQEEFHKIVRAVSRRPDIIYDYEDGRKICDSIEDPLPYDINAKVIEIDDRDYAYFYRDLVEDMEKYAGKTVRLKGLVAVDKKLPPNTIVVGRHIMTCCEADIAYSGLVCIHAVNLPLRTRDWVQLTARIDVEYHKVYGQNGPVLKAVKLNYAQPPEQDLATFY